ncbi:MAG: glycosyltransferase family 2 protein [Candidatus Omnitrophica bacterium]|nr:glycosyltransferase family 2 protein [Candidatus Omnitrophota bacterium]
MKFNFSGKKLTGSERAIQRFFEILPGATSWFILIGMTLLSFWNPILAAVLIIAFDFFWILRLFFMTLFLVISYFRLSLEKETDWMARLHGLNHLTDALTFLNKDFGTRSLPQKISSWIHRKEMTELQRSGASVPDFKKIIHLVLIPIVRETPEILRDSISSFLNGYFPSEQILVVIALEERATEDVKAGAQQMAREFEGKFFDFKVILHPNHIPGEARVKGANVTYAAREMTRYFEQKEILFDRVIVSCFDADTVVDAHYFGCLTYQYMVCPKRERASFQPIPVYHNNIWKVPGFVRVLETGSSFFQLVESTDPEKLVTFSSHSMSFRALVEADYWPVDMISDDSAIFWKCYIHYDGDYRVVPLYVTVSMDVADAGNWWKTIVNVYRQKRRWAWGVENFPIVMRAFLQAKKIPFSEKMGHGVKLFEMHVAWATWAFLLSVIGWLPALFAGREFSHSVLYYSTPRITAIIFGFSTCALVVTIIMSLWLLPKREKRDSVFRRLGFALQWVFVPGIFTFLSTLPALEAQTRLMLGAYMEKWGTDTMQRPAVFSSPAPGKQ